jgi:serine protease inhibitor
LLTDPEQARQEINQAIATATKGQIPRLLSPGSLDDHIGWVLTDALYLHAAWTDPFDPDDTSPGPFSTAAGHAATLNVGEKGTVASAATAVGMQATAGRVFAPQVRFDRPYLMVVTDRATREPLFMARVANPSTR